MSQDLIAILGVGVGLGTVNIVVIGWLLHAIAQSEQRAEARIKERFDTLERHNQERSDAQEKRMDRIEQRMAAQDTRIQAVEAHMHSIDKQLARIGGLLDGLREAIVQRATRE